MAWFHRRRVPYATYDPELARQLLAESSYGSAENLPQIRLHVGEAGFGGQVGHLNPHCPGNAAVLEGRTSASR